MNKRDMIQLPPMTALQVTHIIKACNLYKKKAQRDTDPNFVPAPGKKNSQLAKQEIMGEVLTILNASVGVR